MFKNAVPSDQVVLLYTAYYRLPVYHCSALGAVPGRSGSLLNAPAVAVGWRRAAPINITNGRWRIWSPIRVRGIADRSMRTHTPHGGRRRPTGARTSACARNRQPTHRPATTGLAQFPGLRLARPADSSGQRSDVRVWRRHQNADTPTSVSVDRVQHLVDLVSIGCSATTVPTTSSTYAYCLLPISYL